MFLSLFSETCPWDPPLSVSEKVLEHPCLVSTKKTPHDQVLLPYLYAGKPQVDLEAWSHPQWWLTLCSPSIVGLGTPEIHLNPHFLCCTDSSGAPCMVLLRVHLLLLTPVLHSLLTLHIPGKAWPSHMTLILFCALSWLVVHFCSLTSFLGKHTLAGSPRV